MRQYPLLLRVRYSWGQAWTVAFDSRGPSVLPTGIFLGSFAVVGDPPIDLPFPQPHLRLVVYLSEPRVSIHADEYGPDFKSFFVLLFIYCRSLWSFGFLFPLYAVVCRNTTEGSERGNEIIWPDESVGIPDIFPPGESQFCEDRGVYRVLYEIIMAS